MTVRLYDSLPTEAAAIRREVFMEEQGFRNEFDELDAHALHMVLWNMEEPAAVCRLIPQENGTVRLGRLAVRKPFRGKGCGKELLAEAEREMRRRNAKEIMLLAQQTAVGFYEKAGYTVFGEPEEDEGCPHRWMRKKLVP